MFANESVSLGVDPSSGLNGGGVNAALRFGWLLGLIEKGLNVFWRLEKKYKIFIFLERRAPRVSLNDIFGENDGQGRSIVRLHGPFGELELGRFLFYLLIT